MSTESFAAVASAYLQATGMPDESVARVVADLSAMARQHLPAAQAPLELSGWHLLDALDCIAPERTESQLGTRVCIHSTLVSAETPTAMAGEAFCWMAGLPEEGAIQLDGSVRKRPTSATDQVDVVAIATSLIRAARWVNATACTRRQPDARALAKSVLELTRPIIDAHVDSGCVNYAGAHSGTTHLAS